MKVKRAILVAGEDPPTGLQFWCEPCGEAHSIRVFAGGWTWNGDEERPTISPSVKCEGYRMNAEGEAMIARGEKVPNGQRYPGAEWCCHCVVTAGMIAYCGDCSHGLAGRTVAMVEWPLGAG